MLACIAWPHGLESITQRDPWLLFPLAWDLLNGSQGPAWEHNRIQEGLALLW